MEPARADPYRGPMRRSVGRWGGFLLAASLTLSGCSESQPRESSDPAPAESDSPSAEPSSRPSPSRDPAYESVTFTASDGQRRSGRSYGDDGRVGVVLSHMGRFGDGPQDWDVFATRLADRGFHVLAYKRRLLYDTIWRDVLGAADYLRRHGAAKVIAGGASIGAMASLRAAEEPGARLDGVIWLAGVLSDSGYDFRRGDVAAIACPTLVVSGADDDYGAGLDARRLHGWLTGPKRLLILDSAEHGTDILDEGGPNARELTRTMLRFVEQTARGDGPRC